MFTDAMFTKAKCCMPGIYLYNYMMDLVYMIYNSIYETTTNTTYALLLFDLRFVQI